MEPADDDGYPMPSSPSIPVHSAPCAQLQAIERDMAALHASHGTLPEVVVDLRLVVERLRAQMRIASAALLIAIPILSAVLAPIVSRVVSRLMGVP